MNTDSHQQTQQAVIAQVDFEESFDAAFFALESALPHASKEVIGDLLTALIDLVLCSLKNQITIGEKNESSSCH